MTTKIAFACVGNAGRSQMAAAYAERERDRRSLDVEVVSGGTDPAESVHGDVIELLQEDGIDAGDRTPRRMTPADVADAAIVVTMGCPAEVFLPEGWDGDHRVWSLEASDRAEQRDEIRRRVAELFDELESR